jgi:hypothetical protein
MLDGGVKTCAQAVIAVIIVGQARQMTSQTSNPFGELAQVARVGRSWPVCNSALPVGGMTNHSSLCALTLGPDGVKLGLQRVALGVKYAKFQIGKRPIYPRAGLLPAKYSEALRQITQEAAKEYVGGSNAS